MSIDTDQQAQAFTILLVDDDLDVLGANARFLRLNDIQVVLADSVTTALQRLEKKNHRCHRY
jgi:DNA-binding NtrC family response regulator